MSIRVVRKTPSTLLKIVLFSALMLLFKTQGASAATFDVAAGNGDINANSSCSLAEAVHNIVNSNQDYTECPEGVGSTQTINLPEGTITLSQDLDPLIKPVNIIGKGRDLSIIDGGGIGMLFRISMIGGPEITNDVTLRDFTARNVSAANGSRCIAITSDYQNLTRKNVTIEDIDLENCGQYAVALGAFSSTNTIRGLNIKNDSAENTIGIAGIYPDNISIADSSVDGYTFGVYIAVPGGVPSTEYGFKIQNTTTTNNDLGMIVMADVGNSDPVARVVNVDLLNNTIVGNDHLIANGSIPDTLSTSGLVAGSNSSNFSMNLNMRNNIVADNQLIGQTKNCFFGTGPAEDNITLTTSNNLSDDACAGKLSGADFVSVAGVSSFIGPLQNNGGEIKTMALLDGSSALDGGISLGQILTDARGTSRPQGVAYDIGAYEKTVNDPGEPGGGGTSVIPTPLPPRTGTVVGLLLAMLVAMSAVGVVAVERYKKSSRKVKSNR